MPRETLRRLLVGASVKVLGAGRVEQSSAAAAGAGKRLSARTEQHRRKFFSFFFKGKKFMFEGNECDMSVLVHVNC